MNHAEHQFQTQIADYLNARWPKVLFLSDVRAAVKLTMPQKARLKRLQCNGFKMPDMQILEPRRGYHGMLIELKAETPFKRNGQLKSSEHLRDQQDAINKLRDRGYLAMFHWDFDACRKDIDWYLEGDRDE